MLYCFSDMKTIRATNSAGFTLIEILAAMGIIAVLAAIATGAAIGYLKATRESTTKRQLQLLNTAYRDYLSVGGG